MINEWCIYWFIESCFIRSYCAGNSYHFVARLNQFNHRCAAAVYLYQYVFYTAFVKLLFKLTYTTFMYYVCALNILRILSVRCQRCACLTSIGVSDLDPALYKWHLHKEFAVYIILLSIDYYVIVCLCDKNCWIESFVCHYMCY